MTEVTVTATTGDQVGTEGDLDLKEALAALISHWFLIATITFTGALLALGFAVFFAQPLYKSASIFRLEGESNAMGALGGLSGVAALVGVGNTSSGGSTETIPDRILARDFIVELADETGLLEDPFYNPPKDPSFFDKFLQFLKLREAGSDATELQYRLVLDNFRENVSVKLSENGLISISVVHSSPQRAYEVATGILEKLIADLQNDKRQRSREQIEYLEGELKHARAGLDTALKSLSDFAVKFDLTSDQELARNSAQLVVLRNQIDVVQTQIAALELIGEAQSEGTLLERSLRDTLLSDYPNVRNDEFRIRLGWRADPSTWERPSGERIEAAKSSFMLQYEQLNDSLIRFQQLARVNADTATQLAELEREAAVKQAVYEAMVTQFETKSFTDGFDSEIAQIYETPSIPLFPSAPRKPFLVAVGLILGFFVGNAVAIGISLVKGTIHTEAVLQSTFGIKPIKSNSKLAAVNAQNPKSSVGLSFLAAEVNLANPSSILVLSTSGFPKRTRMYFDLFKSLVSPKERNAIIFGASKDEFGREAFDELHKKIGFELITVHENVHLSEAEISEQFESCRQVSNRIISVAPEMNDDSSFALTLVGWADVIIVTAKLGQVSRMDGKIVKDLLAMAPSAKTYLIYE